MKIIILFVPTFRDNIQFSTVYFKKNQFGPYGFKNVYKMVFSVKLHQTASNVAYVTERRGYVDCQLKDISDWVFRI